MGYQVAYFIIVSHASNERSDTTWRESRGERLRDRLRELTNSPNHSASPIDANPSLGLPPTGRRQVDQNVAPSGSLVARNPKSERQNEHTPLTPTPRSATPTACDAGGAVPVRPRPFISLA